MARGVLSHLTNLTQPIEWGKRERKGKEERKERDFREKNSTFSLDFPVISPVNSGAARSKVGLPCKSYMTGPDPDTLPGYPGWSRLVESHCKISRECTKGPHLKEK